MVAALILFLLLIIFLAFFVGKNLSNVCTIWFFKDFTQVSVAALVFITFACGILFALLLLLISKLKHSKKKSAEEEIPVEKTKSVKKLFSRKSKKLEKSENSAEKAAVSTEMKTDETVVEKSIPTE